MIWLTEIQAIDPQSGEIYSWSGPRINADSKDEAQNYCNTNGMGYCRVIGQFITDIEITQEQICLN